MGLRARRICQTKVMALIVASSAQLIASWLMWCEARWKLLAVMIIAPNRTAESSAPGASNGEGSKAGCRGSAFRANSRAIVPGTRLMANNHCQRSTSRSSRPVRVQWPCWRRSAERAVPECGQAVDRERRRAVSPGQYSVWPPRQSLQNPHPDQHVRGAGQRAAERGECKDG